MNLLGDLERLATTYTDATGVGLGAVSNRIFSDSKRLPRVFGGQAGMMLDSYEAAIRWFSANWPEGVAWPAGIERPAPEAAPGGAGEREAV